MLADDAKMQVVEEQLAERQLLLPFDDTTPTPKKEKKMPNEKPVAVKKTVTRKSKITPEQKLADAQKEIARLKSVIASMTIVYKDVNKERLELAARLAKVAVAINPKSKKGTRTKKA